MLNNVVFRWWVMLIVFFFFFFQAEDGIRDLVRSRGLGDVYKRQAKRVVARRERRFRDLVIEAKGNSDDVPSDAAAVLLTAEVLAGRIQIEAWDESVEQWIVRVNRLAEWFPELEVNPLTEADRATLIEQICYGETSARGVREKPVMPILRDWLTAEQLAVARNCGCTQVQGYLVSPPRHAADVADILARLRAGEALV
mgnify:CR=1 FL=1